MGTIANKLAALFGDINARHTELTDKIEKLQARRDYLMTSPMPRGDYLDYVFRAIDAQGAGFIDRMENQIKSDGFIAPLKYEGAPRFPAIAPHQPNNAHLSTEATYYLLADTIKASAAKAINAMPWPECGPSLADRKAELAKTEKELASLEKDRAELRQALQQVGADILPSRRQPQEYDQAAWKGND